jgi:hypothetical protein
LRRMTQFGVNVLFLCILILIFFRVCIVDSFYRVVYGIIR